MRNAPLVVGPLLVVASLALVVVQATVASRRDPAARPGEALAGSPPAASTPAPAADEVRVAGSKPSRPRAHAAPADLRYVAIGGGPFPESTEVSLEQNILLASQVFRGPGELLFAGGTHTQSVRTTDRTLDRRSVLMRIGDFFTPRSARRSRFRKPALEADSARIENVERLLTAAWVTGDAPLLVYIAAHGEDGETPRDNHVALWSGEPLKVSRLAELHDQSRRPLRLLIASCFSGGFAELAFKGADPKQGITQAPRCGLFAGTWDREASGCDPNPDRRAQENYSLHLLHALRGQDRDGNALPIADIDYDADGVIGLLDAHTRARIASNSIDIPTSTSERYLREVQRHGSAIDLSASPEDAAVIAQLGARLGVTTREAAELRVDEIGKKLDALDKQLDEAERELDAKHAALAAELLGRWPVLSDAYHTDFQATLAADGPAILQVLDATDVGRAYTAADNKVNRLDGRYAKNEVQESVTLRVLRAYETLELTTALKKRGGAAWDGYQTLRACERLRP